MVVVGPEQGATDQVAAIPAPEVQHHRGVAAEQLAPVQMALGGHFLQGGLRPPCRVEDIAGDGDAEFAFDRYDVIHRKTRSGADTLDTCYNGPAALRTRVGPPRWVEPRSLVLDLSHHLPRSHLVGDPDGLQTVAPVAVLHRVDERLFQSQAHGEDVLGLVAGLAHGRPDGAEQPGHLLRGADTFMVPGALRRAGARFNDIHG